MGKSSNVFFCHVSGIKVEEHKRFLCVEEMKNSSTVMKEPAINGLRGFYVSIKVLSASYFVGLVIPGYSSQTCWETWSKFLEGFPGVSSRREKLAVCLLGLGISKILRCRNMKGDCIPPAPGVCLRFGTNTPIRARFHSSPSLCHTHLILHCPCRPVFPWKWRFLGIYRMFSFSPSSSDTHQTGWVS